MNESEIKELVFAGLRRIAPESEPESLRPDQNIRESLEIDSFDFLRFLVGLNEKTGVEIPEDDYGQLVTLDDMIRYLEARV